MKRSEDLVLDNFKTVIHELADKYSNLKKPDFNFYAEKSQGQVNVNGLQNKEYDSFLNVFNIELPKVIQKFEMTLEHGYKLNKINPEVYNRVINLFYDQQIFKNYESLDSETPLFKYLGISDEDYKSLIDYGKSLIDTKFDDDAYEFFKILAFLDLKNFDARMGLSVSSFHKKEYFDSITFANQAHQINPLNPSPIIYMIYSYINLNEFTKARYIIDKLNLIRREFKDPNTIKIIKKASKLLKSKGV